MKSLRPGILTGGLVGLLLTAPLVAVLYIADQLAGLPFLPFDIFSWVRDILPGNVLTAGIDTMVDVIIGLNLGSVDEVAKTLEQMMGVLMVLVAGLVAAAIYFAIMRRQKGRPGLAGAMIGLVLGVIMAIISAEKNFTATTSPFISFVWLVAVFFAWGAILAWVYRRITPAPLFSDVPPDREAVQLDRRQVLVSIGGMTAILTIAGTGLGLLLNRGSNEPVTISISENDDSTASSSPPDSQPELPPDLPNADAVVQPAPGTRPEYTPIEDHYRIDISPRAPRIDGDNWTLNVSGMIAAPVALTLEELRNNYEPVDQYVTLSCISNWIGGDLISTTRWTGIPLRVLMDEWQVSPSARYMKITGADGFDEYVSVSLARTDERVMLAYAWDGQPLRERNGFPLRVYIPDRYGMKQPKWITDIEFVDSDEEGYWVRRGWSPTAIVRTTSVIDTVAVDAALERDGQILLPIGGIAYSGAKGISKVEVQINDGEWHEAELRDPLSELTWVIWRYDWTFEPGNHTIRVRCYDGAGNMQIEQREGVRPDGATGIHIVERDIAEPEA